MGTTVALPRVSKSFGDWVTYRFDMRRITLAGLTLLLFLVAVGPACLLLATTAMGMPSGVAHPAPMDCGDRGRDTSAACPHANPVEVTRDTPALPEPLLDIVVVTEAVPTDDAGTNLVLSRAEWYGSPPPSHLTPLRL